MQVDSVKTSKIRYLPYLDYCYIILDAYIKQMFQILNSFFHWYKPNGKLSLEEVADEAYRFVNRAISPRDQKKGR